MRSSKLTKLMLLNAFLFCIFVWGLCKPDLADAFSGKGSGTVQDPYTITSEAQFNEIKDSLNASYKLTCDLDLNNVNWQPVGKQNTAFTGIFDGSGYTIKNLSMDNRNVNNIGLFAYVNNAAIKNLNLSNVTVKGAGNTGALVGYAIGTTSIENCSVTEGTVTGTTNIGALIGNATGTVNIDSCSATKGTVTGTSNVGGLVGQNIGTLRKCYSTINVTGTGNSLGGLAGVNQGTVDMCYSAGEVSSTGSYVGGLIGSKSGGVIQESFSLSPVQGAANVGGLLGINNSAVTIKDCYAAGKITGKNAGGICGNNATITNSYYDGVASRYTPAAAYDVSRLTASMKKESNYTDWNFRSIWSIDEGKSYPYIKGMDKPSGVTVGLPENDMSGGNGTKDNPYIISTIQQLININYEPSASYILGKDIDVWEIEFWAPLCNSSVPFTGTFDGKSYTIKNLSIDKRTVSNAGLFAYVNNAAIKNLNLSNVTVKGAGNTGALVGYAIGTTSIENCSITEETVTGTTNIGALIGNATGTVNIDSCSATKGTVTGTSNVGGLVGQNIGTLRKCYSTINVTGTGNSIGGLAGVNQGTVDMCYSTGEVSSTGSYVGGLIGSKSGGVIQESFSLSPVQGAANVGGLLGINSSAVTIKNCYAAGKVTGKTAGGICGNNATITNSYYDGVASRYTPAAAYDVSRLTASMKKESNYTDWNFRSIWSIDEGKSYPYIKGMDKPSGVTVGLPENDMSGGNGTKDNPYIISTIQQSININYEPSASYILGKDIDAWEIEFWTPLCNSSIPFTGTFDGKGYTIKNLNIDKRTVSNAGLFAYVNNATIKNLNLINVTVKGAGNTGALVGYAIGTTSIENCSVTEEAVTGTTNIGALIGNATGTVNIDSCSATKGTVTGTSNVGGLVGQNIGTLRKCYSTINVTGTGNSIGGLTGVNQGTVDMCYSTGEVSSTGSYVGGLIGSKSGGVIQESFSLSPVQGAANVGGLLGINNSAVTIKNCYAAGKVTGKTAGGICGNNATITNSYYDGVASRYTPAAAYDVSRLTASMKKESNYTDWNFRSIWSIDEGKSYPYIKGMDKPSGVTVGLPENDMSGGNGTKDNPYIISTIQQLININYEPSASYILGKDIDAWEIEFWAPLCNSSIPFTGTFDGKGYTIKNLSIDKRTVSNAGLFAYVNNAAIKNLNLSNVTVKGAGNTGALVGYAIGTTSIENCSITEETVTGTTNIGALIGNATGTVNIDSCSATKGTVTGTSNVGGLVGQNIGTLRKCYSTINVTGTGNSIGGLAGVNQGTVDMCYSTGEVSSTGSYVGGLIGSKSGGVIQESFSLSPVQGAANVGGLLGINNSAVTIKDCYAAGKVTGKTAGGICGNNATISNSYYDDSVAGTVTTTQGKTSNREMLNKLNYINWNFNSIWDMYNEKTYPYLKQLPKPMFQNVPELPAAPEGLVIKAKGTESITLAWNKVDGVIGYEVEADGIVKDTVTETSYTHMGLKEGTEHRYRVRVKTEAGAGEWSEIIVSSTSSVVGSIVIEKPVTTDTSITLVWNKVEGAIGYDVEADGAVKETVTATTYIHTGLKAGTRHEYRVRAKTASGVGEWSEMIVASTTSSVVGSVVIEKPTVTNNSVTLVWNKVEGAIGYDVEADGAVKETVTATTYIHSGLKAGTQHVYRVRAKTASGMGEWSKIAVASTTADVKNVIVLDKTTVTLSTDETQKLTATTSPSAIIIWTSSNEAVAKVDTNGNIRAVGTGTAVITAKIDGTNISAVCTVNVSGIAMVLNLEPEKSKIKLNEIVSVPLIIDNIKEIAAEDIRIKYDSSKLEYIGAVEVDGIKLVKNDVQKGELRFILASKGLANVIQEKRTLLKLNFKAIAAGDAIVDVVKGKVSDGIEMEKDLNVSECGQAKISIEKAVLNDVNKDGKFTLLDLAIDARHFGENPDALPQYNTDIVLNQAIDDDDLTEIARFMLDNPEYT